MKRKVIKTGAWSAYWKDKTQGYHVYFGNFGQVCIYFPQRDVIKFHGAPISMVLITSLPGFLFEIKNLQ